MKLSRVHFYALLLLFFSLLPALALFFYLASAQPQAVYAARRSDLAGVVTSTICPPPNDPVVPGATPVPVCCSPGSRQTKFVASGDTPDYYYDTNINRLCCEIKVDKLERVCSGSPCGKWGPWQNAETNQRQVRCVDLSEFGASGQGPFRIRGKCVDNEPGKRYVKTCNSRRLNYDTWCLNPQYKYDNCGDWQKVDDPSCKACKPLPGTNTIVCQMPECPPGWTQTGMEVRDGIVYVYCKQGCPENAECAPGDTRSCGGNGVQYCTPQCRWGPCTRPPDCLTPPSCAPRTCGVDCTWETLRVSADAGCGVAQRRPYPYALVGAPVQLQLMCDSVTGEVSETFRGATLDQPPAGPENDTCGTRPEPYNEPVETCDKQWIYKLYARYELSCRPGEAVWDMDEYPQNVGRRSSDIMSPYVASDPLGNPLSGRRVSEIMRDLYPDDPLLIRATRTGSIVRHIYERSSAGKSTTGPNGMPAYDVRVSIPWQYVVRFEYTRRIPRPCEIIEQCGGANTRTGCICSHGYDVDCVSDDNCRCKKRAYQGADESPQRIPHAIIAGTFYCNKVEDDLFPNECRGVPIPVMEVQSVVR